MNPILRTTLQTKRLLVYFGTSMALLLISCFALLLLRRPLQPASLIPVLAVLLIGAIYVTVQSASATQNPDDMPAIDIVPNSSSQLIWGFVKEALGFLVGASFVGFILVGLGDLSSSENIADFDVFSRRCAVGGVFAGLLGLMSSLVGLLRGMFQ